MKTITVECDNCLKVLNDTDAYAEVFLTVRPRGKAIGIRTDKVIELCMPCYNRILGDLMGGGSF